MTFTLDVIGMVCWVQTNCKNIFIFKGNYKGQLMHWRSSKQQMLGRVHFVTLNKN